MKNQAQHNETAENAGDPENPDTISVTPETHLQGSEKIKEAWENRDNPQLTFGEKAAGIGFNPGGHSEVDVIKGLSAQLIDQFNVARNATNNPDKKRYYSKAISHIEDGQMNGVKAATWQH